MVKNSKNFKPEPITPGIVSKLPAKTVDFLYEEAKGNLSSLHEACIRIIDRCYRLQNWLISFITALIGYLAYSVASGKYDRTIIILSIFGLLAFGSISLYLLLKTMLNVDTYDVGVEPSTPIRKEMMDYIDSGIPQRSKHKHILGAPLATLQSMIEHNKGVCSRLVKAYRIAIRSFLLSIWAFLFLLLLLILF